MPDQYSEQSDHLPDPRTPIAGARCPSTGFHLFRKKIDALCDTVRLTGTDSRIHQLHERSQFSSPDNFPVRLLAASDATSAPLMIINLRFADRHIPVFMPPNYPFHGLTRAMLLEEIRRTIIPDSGHRVTGSITIFS